MKEARGLSAGISPCRWARADQRACPKLPGWQWSESHSLVADSLRPHGLYSPWNSPGQNTGVGSLSLPQGIFPTQGSNSGLPYCRQILYQLSQQGSPGRGSHINGFYMRWNGFSRKSNKSSASSSLRKMSSAKSQDVRNKQDRPHHL